jgi:hypothetical protein
MINASGSVAMVPQMYSHDYQVRVSAATLMGIAFDHLYTVQDAAVLDDAIAGRIAGRRAGFTEWQGVCGRTVVSLAWDWVELSDGFIRPLDSVAPRSNLKLIDARGYDLAADTTAASFWLRINALDWHGSVGKALAPVASGP